MYELIYKEIGFGQAVGFSFLIGKLLIVIALLIFFIRRKLRFNFKTHLLFQATFLSVTIVAMSAFRTLLGFKPGSYTDPLLEAMRFFGGILGSGTMAFATGLLADAISLDSPVKKRIRSVCAVLAIILHIAALFFWINYEYDKYGFSRARQTQPKFNLYETAGYKEMIAYTDYDYNTASGYREKFVQLVDRGKYDEAISYIKSVLEGPAPENTALGRGVIYMTGNALVKALYRQGKLRDAIIARKKSLALSGKSQFNENEIVELWQLQDMYKNQVGFQAYEADKAASTTTLELDPQAQKIKINYLKEEVFRGGDKLQVEIASFQSDYYFMHLDFEKAEAECKKGIEAFYRLRKRFQTKDYEYMRGLLEFRLISILTIQGKYDEALSTIDEMKKTYSEYGPRILKQMEKALEEARRQGLKPADIAYPQLDNAASPNTGFYIRDKGFNRLDSDEPKTTDWVVVKHL